METTFTKMRNAAPSVLRIGMSIIILWFGYQQVTDPTTWIGFLPAWTTVIPISQTGLVFLNGTFEIVFGVFLFLGFYTRFVSLILALHMFDITYVVGLDAIGMRDLGLSIGILAIFLYGADDFSVDAIYKNKAAAVVNR